MACLFYLGVIKRHLRLKTHNGGRGPAVPFLPGPLHTCRTCLLLPCHRSRHAHSPTCTPTTPHCACALLPPRHTWHCLTHLARPHAPHRCLPAPPYHLHGTHTALPRTPLCHCALCPPPHNLLPPSPSTPPYHCHLLPRTSAACLLHFHLTCFLFHAPYHTTAHPTTPTPHQADTAHHHSMGGEQVPCCDAVAT